MSSVWLYLTQTRQTLGWSWILFTPDLTPTDQLSVIIEAGLQALHL